MRHRKGTNIALALTFVVLVSPAMLFAKDANSGPEVLTNDNVITMVKAGLSTSIIGEFQHGCW